MHSAWWRERLHVENRAASAPASQDIWARSNPIDVHTINSYPSGSQTQRLPTTRLPPMNYDGATVWPPLNCEYTQTLLPSRGMMHEARYHPASNPYLQGRSTAADQQYIQYASHPTTASCTGATPHSSSIASNTFHSTWSPMEKINWLYQDPTHLLTARAAIFTSYDRSEQTRRSLLSCGRIYDKQSPSKHHPQEEEEGKRRFSAGRKLCSITSIKEEHLRRKVYV